jgi:hypothetical protein
MTAKLFNTVSLRVALIGFVALVAGCAVAPRVAPVTQALDESSARCVEILDRVDTAVTNGGAADGMAARVAGFPHLRVNRFLASYARDVLDEDQFTEWVKRMAALGVEAYAVELANLPLEQAGQLARELQEIGPMYTALRPAVAECSKRLAAADSASPERRVLLREAARVPEEYVDWQRVAGLYWLTRIPFAYGVRRWQDDVRHVFAQPLNALPVTGELKRYAAPPGVLSSAEVSNILERSSNNALGIPDPGDGDLEALFRTFAPRFEIDTAGEADRPGELAWREDAAPQIDPARAVGYRRVSHTRHLGRALLQLNYAIWFAERPKDAGWDILGGHLDGLIWRVTLAPDGAPWVFDSIHQCGCYHQFFPTARARLRTMPPTLDETAFVPQNLPRLEAGERVTLRVASGTHYLQRVIVRADPAPDESEYVFAEDDALRSLPLASGGRRSAFRADGIVPGTERDERYLFWPMGVPEPGAMRQWGRHATAFVGRRHFDDADLFDRYFEMTPP